MDYEEAAEWSLPRKIVHSRHATTEKWQSAKHTENYYLFSMYLTN